MTRLLPFPLVLFIIFTSCVEDPETIVITEIDTVIVNKTDTVIITLTDTLFIIKTDTIYITDTDTIYLQHSKEIPFKVGDTFYLNSAPTSEFETDSAWMLIREAWPYGDVQGDITMELVFWDEPNNTYAEAYTILVLYEDFSKANGIAVYDKVYFFLTINAEMYLWAYPIDENTFEVGFLYNNWIFDEEKMKQSYIMTRKE